MMKLITTTFLLVLLTLSSVDAARGRFRGEPQEAGEMKLGRRNLMSGSKEGGGKMGDKGMDMGMGMGMNRPPSLTFRYILPAGTSEHQDEGKATCRADNGPFPQTASISFTNEDGETVSMQVDGRGQGTEFIIDGPFGATSTFTISSYGSCTIHTSCSQPLVGGDKFGPLELVTENACFGTPPDDCIICDSNNRQRPDTLTLSYSFDGKNSNYQDSSKATCREASYPTNPLYIDVYDKNFKNHQERINGPFSFGQTFTIGEGYDLETETGFKIPGWQGGDGDADNACFFHTSCSQPLVIGDRIGPFNILEGNECLQCIEPDKGSYDCGENITVQFSFGTNPLRDDWIGIYPCDETEYNHAIVYQWTCTDDGNVCKNRTVDSGTIVFDSLPPYNAFGPHIYPVPPYTKPDGSINRCYKAVLLRNEGISVPPYQVICESSPFTIMENEQIEGCSIASGRPPIP